MYHFLFDAYKTYRSRLDDIALIHEFLEEIPLKMGLKTIMPPFILPYYNGIVPEDCGISGFVFLNGGHFTIHTFSYRGVFFCDLLSPVPFDDDRLGCYISDALPSERNFRSTIERKPGAVIERPAIDVGMDFGPHLMIDFGNFTEPESLDRLFPFMDDLPNHIGMTPIMRPYGIRNGTGKKEVVSIMTMIAESHICLHVFPTEHRAFFDLFSCTFFDTEPVLQVLRQELKGNSETEILISRGNKYKMFKERKHDRILYSRAWLKNASTPSIRNKSD